MGMRRIPARIRKVIADRTKAAQKFMALDAELVDWMIEQDVDITHWKLRDNIHGGCESIVNPKASEENILYFLNCWPNKKK